MQLMIIGLNILCAIFVVILYSVFLIATFFLLYIDKIYDFLKKRKINKERKNMYKAMFLDRNINNKFKFKLIKNKIKRII